MSRPKPTTLDLSPLRDLFRELPTAIINRIKRERFRELIASHEGIPDTLRMIVKVSEAAWGSIRFLCTDLGDVPARKVEFCTAVPPLTRSLLDSLFSLIFIFDDPTPNMRWFLASGWKDLKRHHERLLARHGADPAWAAWLKMHEEKVRFIAQRAAITPDEEAGKIEVDWWPIPGAMVKVKASKGRKLVPWRDLKRREFLAHMNERYYGQLSADSHVSYTGLDFRGHLFLEGPEIEDESDDERVDRFDVFRSNVVMQSMALYAALFSEVVGQLKLPYEANRLRFFWNHCKDYPNVKELYDLRYDGWLPSGA
jgi:hypothetical protein